MILDLLLKPITASKKLFNTISQNILIGLSIAIPLLIALIPAFIVKDKISSVLNPLVSLSSILGENVNKGASNITSSINSLIFKFIFTKVLLLTLIVTIFIFGIITIFFNYKNIKVSTKHIWQAMMISAIQIAYYVLIGSLLSYLSYYFVVICLTGILNSIICLYALLSECIEMQPVTLPNESEIKPEQTTIEQELGFSNLETAATVDIAVQAPIINKPIIANVQQAPVIPLSEKVKGLTSKQRKIYFSIISVVVICIILFYVGSSLTSKESISKGLVKAIKDNNVTDMAKYITASDSRLTINADSLGAFDNYLKDNPAYTSKLLATIDSQGNSKDTNSSGDNINKNGLITLKTSGKKFIFFNRYVYELPSYFIRVTTEYKNTEVSFNNKLVYTSNSDNQTKECGPYLPGKYSLDAKLKTDFAEVKGNQVITLNPEGMSTNIVETGLTLKGEKLEIYSNYKDAKIIINGKDTGITVANLKSLPPLPNDGSCKVLLENQFPWGALKSNEIAFGKDNLEFTFDKKNSALMDSIKPAILDFMKGYEAAYKAFDYTKLVNVTDRYKNILIDDINYKKNDNEAFTGATTSVMASTSSFNLNYNSDNNNYTLNVNITINGDLSIGGGSPFFNYSSYNMLLEYNENQKKWLIDGLNGNWFSDPVKDGTEIKIN